MLNSFNWGYAANLVVCTVCMVHHDNCRKDTDCKKDTENKLHTHHRDLKVFHTSTPEQNPLLETCTLLSHIYTGLLCVAFYTNL